jgi:hypothetical protein
MAYAISGGRMPEEWVTGRYPISWDLIGTVSAVSPFFHRPGYQARIEISRIYLYIYQVLNGNPTTAFQYTTGCMRFNR